MTRIYIAICLIASLLLTGCNAGSTNKPTDSTDQSSLSSEPTIAVEGLNTLRIAMVDEPLNLDFTSTAGSAIPTILMHNVYETLVTIDKNGLPQPGLATWTVDATGKTYTFSLNQATFSNGDAFTSHTAKFSLEHVKEWTTTDSDKLDAINDIATPDDETLVVTLTRPSHEFLFTLASSVGAMLTPTGMSELATNPIGTGPFIIGERVPGDHITLTARKPDRTGLSVVVFKYFKDSVAPINAIQTGEIDVIWYLQNLAAIPTLSKDFTITYGDTSTKVMIVLNNKTGVFANKDARVAVTHAIDKQAVLDIANERFGKILQSATALSDPWNISKPTYPYDVNAAKAIVTKVTKANGGKAPQVSLKVPTLTYAMTASEIVLEQLKTIGFDATLTPSEFPATWIQDVYTNHDFDMTIIAHPEAHDFAKLMDGNYYIGNTNPKIPELVKIADAAPDNKQWIKLMTEATQMSVDDAVIIPLYNLPNTTVMSKRVRGLTSDTLLPELDVTEVTLGS